MKTVTEGIIKAEGLTYQVVIALMKVILPWKGKLTATFTLGVLRVIAFIGVGVLSALIVLALKNHQPYAGYAIGARHRRPCRASCTGSSPGWPTTWPSACWPRCASTPSASSTRWRRPIWCAGAPAI